MNTSIAYSVVIPHHNTPDLLLRCLRSIPERKDIEILVADDKSDIVEGELQYIVASHPQARLICIDKNKGAGHARNVALGYAVGHWLVFADADDYFTPAIATVFDKYAADKETDMVFLNALSVDEEGNTAPTMLSRYIANLKRHRPYSSSVLKFATWTPWSRMVKRSIVEQNNVKFDEVPVGNDAMFVLKVTSLAQVVAVEPTVCYHYFQPTTGSQTWKRYTDSTLIQRTELRFKTNEFYRKVGYPFLWPITSKISYKDLDVIQRKQLLALCKRYNHSCAKELIARASQLFGKLLRCL